MKADALVSRLSNIALFVMAADCAPIILYNHDTGVLWEWEWEVEIFKKDYTYCIKKTKNKEWKYLLDIWAIAIEQLINSWVEYKNIIISWECTYKNHAKYHSYRRHTHKSEEGYGNNVFGIWINN